MPHSSKQGSDKRASNLPRFAVHPPSLNRRSLIASSSSQAALVHSDLDIDPSGSQTSLNRSPASSVEAIELKDLRDSKEETGLQDTNVPKGSEEPLQEAFVIHMPADFASPTELTARDPSIKEDDAESQYTVTLTDASLAKLANRLQLEQERLPKEAHALQKYLESIPSKHVRVQFDLTDMSNFESPPPAVTESSSSLQVPQAEPAVRRRKTTMIEQERLEFKRLGKMMTADSTDRTDDKDGISQATGEDSATADALKARPIHPRFKMIIEQVETAPHHLERIMTAESTRKSSKVFRPPKTEIDREAESEEKERNATWLELAYDIFYVAAIRILSHASYTDWTTLAGFIIKFSVMWWSWLMVTLYDTKYDTDDVFHRLMKFIQMCCVAGFSLSAAGALEYEVTSDLFIVSFMGIRLTLLINYIVVYLYASGKVGKTNAEEFYAPPNFNDTPRSPTIESINPSLLSTSAPSASVSATVGLRSISPPPKPLRPNLKATLLLVVANSISILLFGLSMLIQQKQNMMQRAGFWVASMLVDLAVNLYLSYGRKQIPFRGSHLPERIGLFTIIVLGECAIAVLEEGGNSLKLINTLNNLKAKGAEGSQLMALGGPIDIYPNGSDGSLALEGIHLFETLLVCFFFMVNFFCLWWMYFDDFASHTTNLYRLKQGSIFDRMRNLWIYIHLPYHILITLLGVTMVDVIVQVFIASIASAGSKVMQDKEKKTDEAVAVEMIALFASTFLLNALFKLMHVYNSTDSMAKLTYLTRFGFALGIGMIGLTPLYRFATPVDFRSEQLTPLTYLVMALTLCCVLQVLFDVFIQYRLSLKQTQTRTETMMSSRDIRRSISRDLSRDIRSAVQPTVNGRTLRNRGDTSIVRVGEAYPLQY